MNCRDAQHGLPGYLDDSISASERAGLREHLQRCADCRQELKSYSSLAAHLAHVDPIRPPANLALSIQVQASRRRMPWASLTRAWNRVLLISQNILEPLAVPATGGVLTAVGVFLLVVQSILGGMPAGGVYTNDLPLNFVQPAQLESLAPFPVPGIGGTNGRATSGALLLEATLDAQGEVVFYKILSGPNDVEIQHQIDQVLLFSRFRPQLGFGRPMGGGHVLLNFNEVHVRG
jgi:anti-sigma factor RsiW